VGQSRALPKLPESVLTEQNQKHKKIENVIDHQRALVICKHTLFNNSLYFRDCIDEVLV
jgi:hypothetical protein